MIEREFDLIRTSFTLVFIALLGMGGILASSAQAQDPPDWPVDVTGQLLDGVAPKVTIALGDEHRGRIRISENAWWMFLLHMRPLDESAPLSLRTTKDLLINFWNSGSASAELTGDEGVYETMSIQAYYADALFTRGTIKTRFLVWDDPERNRRMIADMNINIGFDTPDSLLLVTQQLMALSARPSNTPPPGNLPGWLTETTSFQELDLAINHPEDCAVSTFPGFNSLRGERDPSEWASLWALPVGLNWRFDLLWGPMAPDPVEQWIAEQLPDSLGGGASMTVESVDMEELAPGKWIGKATTKTINGPRVTIDHWRIAAAEWKSQGNTYRTLAACRVYDEKWGIEINGRIDDSLLHKRMARWMSRMPAGPNWRPQDSDSDALWTD